MSALTKDITLIKGDAYKSAVGRALTFPEKNGAAWPDLSEATLGFSMIRVSDPEAAAVAATPTHDAGPPQTLTVELEESATANLADGANEYRYALRATVGSDRITLYRGLVTVLPDA